VFWLCPGSLKILAPPLPANNDRWIQLHIITIHRDTYKCARHLNKYSSVTINELDVMSTAR